MRAPQLSQRGEPAASDRTVTPLAVASIRHDPESGTTVDPLALETAADFGGDSDRTLTPLSHGGGGVIPAGAGAMRAPQPVAYPIETVGSSSRAELRSHVLASGAGLLLAGAFQVLSEAAPPTPSCSRLSSTAVEECRCTGETWPADHRAFIVGVIVVAFLAVAGLSFVHQWGAMGAPAHPRRAFALMVLGPPLVYALSTTADVPALGLLLITLCYLVAVMRWRPGFKGKSFRAAVPYLSVPPLSVIWSLLFADLLPEMLREHSEATALLLGVQALFLSCFSLVFVRAMRPFLVNWPHKYQVQLVRTELQRMSGAHIAMTLGTVVYHDYQFADLHAGHPVMVSLYTYVLLQLAMRCHLLSVTAGLLSGLSFPEIYRRRPVVLGVWGTAKDARFWAYVPAVLMRVLPRGGESPWLYNCDGSFAELGGIEWVMLLLAADVVLEVLYLGLQARLRRRYGPENPFSSPWIVTPPAATVLHVFGVVSLAPVGQMVVAWAVARREGP